MYKRSTLLTRIAVATTLLFASTAGLAADALSEEPGYVDFGDLSALTNSEPSVEISLGSALIRFLCAATEEEEPELAESLCNLRSIRITVFEMQPQDYAEAQAHAKSISEDLESKAWEPAVVMRAEESTVRMYMRTVDDKVAGMAVMVIEPGSEAVFMNIVGEIDPAKLGRVASKFGVSLDDVNVDID
jgi:hypothetical protein